jgi:hypothetical protein
MCIYFVYYSSNDLSIGCLYLKTALICAIQISSDRNTILVYISEFNII